MTSVARISLNRRLARIRLPFPRRHEHSAGGLTKAAWATTVPVIVNNAPVLIEVPAPLSLRELTEIAAFCAMVPEDPLEVVTRLPLAVVSPTLTRGVVKRRGSVGDHRIEACVGRADRVHGGPHKPCAIVVGKVSAIEERTATDESRRLGGKRDIVRP